MLWSLLPASALAAEAEPEIEAETVEVQAARIKWYDKHEVRVKYVFNDNSGKTKSDDTKESIDKIGAIQFFSVAEKGYECSVKLKSGSASCWIDDLNLLHVTKIDADSVVTVTYTPKKNMAYLDQYYKKEGVIIDYPKWNKEHLSFNGPDVLDNNRYEKAYLIQDGHLTELLESARFLDVDGTIYDFTVAKRLPSDLKVDLIDKVWYDREDAKWYYTSSLTPDSPTPFTSIVNLYYGEKHTKDSEYHLFNKNPDTVAPTCTEKGYTVYQCAYCEKTETRDETPIDPNNHDWGAWVHNDAETMEKSSHTRVCKLNASHTETKDCTFVVEKDGKSVCSVCGGTYVGAPKTYTVTYDANGGYYGNATGSITTKEDPKPYGVHDVANLAYAGEYVPQHDDVDGSNVLFLGWSTEKVPGIISFSADPEDPETVAAYLKTTVTMDGDKTVYAVWGTDTDKNGTPDVFQAKVTYKVVDGWWTDNGTVLPDEKIVAWFDLYAQQADHTWKKCPTPVLGDTVPVGHSGKPGYTGIGWFMDDNRKTVMENGPDSTTQVTKPVTLYTFVYKDATHKYDVYDVLNSLVYKDFQSRYGENTTAEFTVTATMRAGTLLPLPDTEEVKPEGTEITGKVSISTKDQPKAFVFERPLGYMNPEDGDYFVEVTETDDGTANVTFDHRTFRIAFCIKNGAVDQKNIQISYFADNELTPAENATFVNTYTKKTTSRDDDSDTYSYVVKKVDAQDGHALKDAKFGLYADDKQIATAISGSKGYARFSLDERVYNKLNKNDDLYVMELTAPDGYVKSSRKYDVSVNAFVKNNVLGAQEHAITVTNSRSSTP